ncbi:hypothetical protein [Nocardia asteroides]|nr:hypothetical protein [Nocardia asteroides]UGT61418.1 hypothetical protein LTT61_30565 [Nocardia asteroides]
MAKKLFDAIVDNTTVVQNTPLVESETIEAVQNVGEAIKYLSQIKIPSA